MSAGRPSTAAPISAMPGPAVVFDVLARLLRHVYGADSLVYARNVTDVDDKIIEAARAEGVEPSVITERYERLLSRGHGRARRRAARPRAARHRSISTQMVAMIARLIEAGNAYEADGHVLFHVPSRPRLRRARPPRPRGDDRRRPGRGRDLQEGPGRFRAVEAVARGRDRLGLALGPRPARAGTSNARR